ncbi:MobF family relaxase [Burkholderia gladioli]|uniref:MobF family relaxase n=1 Tax=Burkholderia gladioli TaxID=28095 RepID=UPI000D0011EE|nr:MobF family relaxase [Burkholderia gladioli]PRE88277.1 exonuclease V subunit alpha [Burkholderia gladioli]
MVTMMALSPKGHDKNGNNIINYFLAKEARYYVNEVTGKIENQTTWMGKGAEALGLKGEVSEEVLLNLLNGKLPDGAKGVQNVGRGGRRAAFDMCATAEKTVSMLMADPTNTPEEREAIIQAHKRAARMMIKFVESELYARVGAQGNEIVRNVGMIAAEVTHYSNRDLDPNLHSHYIVMNMVHSIGPDGKERVTTFENSTLMAIKHAAGAIYRNQLAHEIQDLGYQVNKHIQLNAKGRETGDVFFRVAGIDEESRNAHSKRRMDILAYMEAHPEVTEDQAAERTRKDKDEPSIQELREIWKREFEERRQRNPNAYQSVAALKNPEVVSNLGHKDVEPVKGQEKQQDMTPKSDDEILKTVHVASSLFTRYELMKQVAFEYVGRLDMRGVLEKTNAILDDAKRVLAFEHDPKTGVARYASQAMVDLEAGIIKKAAARADEQSIRLTKEQVDAGLAKFQAKNPHLKLNAEQEGSVRYICSDTGGNAIISGRAGTGKTTSFIATKITWEEAGGKLIGVSESWKAAKKLQSESGVESYSTRTTLHRIKNGKLPLDSKTMLIIDEAGMQTSQSIAEMQDLCDKAGAKLVLMGDHLQLQPVGAGSGFRIMQARIQDHALKEIRRQREERDRVTANMLYDERDGQKIFERYLANGHIRTSETELEARAALVRDYFKTEGQGEPETVKLMVGGELREVDMSVRDKVVFSAGDKALGIHANDTGVVKGMELNENGEGFLIEVEVTPADLNKKKHTVSIDTSQFNDFNRDFAQTIVICGTNREVQQMNEDIRKGFKERGLLGEDQRVRLIVNEEWRQEIVATGDKVLFTEKHDDLGVSNGEGGVITQLRPSDDKQSHIMTIRLVSEIPEQNGRYVSFDTKDCPDVMLAYAGTVHKSQGQSIDKVLHFVGPAGLHMVNNQSALVAMTRMKTEYGIYGLDEDLLGRIDEDGTRRGGIAQALTEQALNVTTMDVKQITREEAKEIRPQQRGASRRLEPIKIPAHLEAELATSRTEEREALKARGIAQAAESEEASRRRLAGDPQHAADLRARAAVNEREATATQAQSGFVASMTQLNARKAAARAAYEARQKAEAQAVAKRAAEQAVQQAAPRALPPTPAQEQQRKLEAERSLRRERDYEYEYGRSR